jgi:hypothetical protein
MGSTIALVVLDAQSADITAIQRITTQNISTMSFPIIVPSCVPSSDFSPCAPMSVSEKPHAFRVSGSSPALTFIHSAATIINTSQNASAADT